MKQSLADDLRRLVHRTEMLDEENDDLVRQNGTLERAFMGLLVLAEQTDMSDRVLAKYQQLARKIELREV